VVVDSQFTLSEHAARHPIDSTSVKKPVEGDGMTEETEKNDRMEICPLNISNDEKYGFEENTVQEILNGLIETSMNNTSEAYVPTLPVLSSSIYRVRILLGEIKSQLMNAIDAAFDTYASAYIIRRDVLPPEYKINPCEKMPRLVNENGGRLEFEGVATVTIRIGSMTMPADFLVAREFSVPLILGMAFIDEHVSAIFPEQNSIVLKDLSEVAIIHYSVETSSVKTIRD
jgi:hypothetical protein